MSADDTEAGWLRVHDANTGDVIRDLIPPTPGLVPSAVAFSAEGDKLALAAQGLARVWDTTTWEVVLTPSELTDAEHFTAVGFSPDGSLLATMSIPVDLDWPIDVNLWDLATQRDVSQLLHGPRFDRGTTQFSPDGRVILIAGAGRPQIAEPYTGRLLARLEAPPAYAGRAAFSPDGSRIATAEADGTVRIWDTATAEEQLVLVGHTAEVVSVTFSPTGEQLASVSLDGTMRVWALDLSDLLEIARGRVTRDLTDAECRSYIGRGCAPAAAPERLLPAAADWSEAVGISEDAWLSALPGGMWREGPEVPAGGVAFDTESGQLVVFEEWVATWAEEPGTGEWHAGTAIPGSGGEEFGGFGSVIYHPGLDLILVNRSDDGATLGYDVDADTWSELIPGRETFPQCDVKPSECRYGYQMVYDAESELIVLFGGAQWGRIEEGRHAGLGDTWTYDAAATTWTDQTTDEAPPPRVNHTAAYDSQSDRVIVFGGATKVGGEPLGDTWTYDTNTNTWTEMHPVVSPPARAGAMTWYDPQADLVFLFGGAGDWSAWPPMPWLAFGGEELWAYDFESDNWTLYRADPNPGYRLTGEVIFDPRSGEALLIGGDTYNADRQFQGWIGDVWVYRHDPTGN